MKVLSSKAHGILDYATVLFLALSPSLFDMSFPVNMMTYSLAFIHLCLTLLTQSELGAFKIIPLRLHGLIELCVSILLLVTSFLFRIWNDELSFYFYFIFSILLFVVWLISDYTQPSVS